MRRSSLIGGVSYGALLVAMTHSALADNLTIGNGTTLNTPQATATAANGTPGNITIQQGGNITIDQPGTAVTLNSDNSIDHSGLIQATGASDSIGIHILGSYHGSFTAVGSNNSIINVTGSGTGNYGLLLDGTDAFTGNITFQSGSSLIVYGQQSVGVAINAPLIGSLTTSSIQMTGEGATGVLITKQITGSYANVGSISARGTATFTVENVDPLSSSGIAIGASITGGFLNSGPVSGSDGSTPAGRVTNSSTAPTVIIAPSVAGTSAANIVIGKFVTDTAGLDFSFLNRGTLTASQNDTGVTTTGVRIGENGTAAFTTLLTNGIYNRGSIQSSSESDNRFSTSATAVPTDAIGLEIGNGATITPYTAPSSITVSTAGWTTKAASGSTTTTILLGADASNVDGVYNGFQVTVGSTTATVTDYNVVFNDDGTVASKTLTLSTALPSAPTTTDDVTLHVNSANSVQLVGGSDIANAYNGFTILAGTERRTISDYIVIFNPADNTVTMKVAKITGTNGVPTNWTTPPVGGSAFISTSALFNAGSITASMGGDKGGTVTAILIQPGGNLPSLTNLGVINAIASTSDTSISSLKAVAINDLSGTLNTIVTSGTINARATALTGGTEVAIAADLSHSTTPQSFLVLGGGEVNGDIIFGAAATGVVGNTTVQGNRLWIEGAVERTSGNVTTLDRATVSGAVRSNGGTLDIYVSEGGTGGLLRTTNTQATSLSVRSLGAVEFAIAKDAGSAPLISTTGSVVFGSNTSLSLTPTSFLPANGTYTLISTGSSTGLSVTNFASAAGLSGGQSPFPFLFKGAFSTNAGALGSSSGAVTAQTLYVTLQRKSASELGLAGNSAAIYEPLADAALGDDAFGAALLTLTTAEQVQAAVATSVPDIAGGMRSLTVAMTDQATGVIGARQRNLLTAPPGTRDEFRFWGQEFYSIIGYDGTTNQTGFGGAGQGVAVGAEWGTFATGRYGFGYTFFSSQETERHPRDTKTNGDWNMLSAYAAWRFNDFYVAPQVNVGSGEFKSRRSIAVGDIIGRSATAKWNGYVAAGGVTTGYIFDLTDNIQIIPTLAVDLMYLKHNAYDEVGGGGMGLSLKGQNQSSVRSFAGVIGQGSYAFSDGRFMPQLLAGWSHEFVNDPATIDGSFESSPGSPFHLVGPTLNANKVVGGMSFGYVVNNWSAGFNYDASANSGTLSQSATFSVSSRF